MLKGSYTIEAAVWVSILFFVFLTAIGEGVRLCQECKAQETIVFDAVGDFYRKSSCKNMMQE